MKTAVRSFLTIAISLLFVFQSTSVRAATGVAGMAYTLPDAKAGAAYEFRIKTEGGQPPLRWSVIEGELPPGIELLQAGVLKGTPSSARSRAYEFTLQVSDSSEPPQTYSQRFALVVAPSPLRMVPGGGGLIIVAPDHRDGSPTEATRRSDAEPSATPHPFSLEKAVISGALKGGNDSVRGFITPRAEKVFIEVYSDPRSGSDSLVSRVPVKTIDINTGEFTEKLTSPLKKDQKVRVVGLLNERDRQVQLISDEVAVAAAEEQPKAPLPVIKRPLIEGAHNVSGIALPDKAQSKPTKIRVGVYNGKELAQVEETEDLKKTGDFTVSFEEPLKAGQTVRAQAFVGKTEGEKASDEDNRYEVEAPGDWGRARANFAFGAIFSKERDDFSKADPYLNFSLDWNWLRRKEERSNFTYLFNTFFETRLTAIPIDRDKVEQDKNAAGSGSVGQAADNPPAKPQCDPTTTDGFLCSRKSVMVQIGAYLPVYWNNAFTWSHNGKRNALFVAPILKAGMNTLTSDGKNDKNLFTFYSGGLRFGHHEGGRYIASRSWSKQVAPNLVSYLDITLGKWQNIEYQGRRQLRTGFEGRVKIPALPLRFGFEANVGKGPDDLRFLVDTNFDIGKMFKKLTDSN